MKSVNKVTLIGHVTNDPEVKAVASGQTVCIFGLATNRFWKDAKGETQSLPEFHNLVAWRGLGEFCGKNIKKGKPLFVEGRLKTGSWENPQGVKLHKTEIVVENVVFLGPKDKSPETEVVATEEEAAVAA
jgi:single-strand DNA-binding protein